ncbi:TIGR02587 family membrane protein [Ramlibacter sp. PS3R-8]|uniref:TIGR02587 family membrane protein n=1 Tax=Ramlibacter sp. PS3R-8 TaxID=3133437 RepID=UPI0030B61C93
MSSDSRPSNARFARGLARAFAGAILFVLPLLMTMEMWWLGFGMPGWKLVLLLVLFFPFLVVLSWHSGFEPTFSWRDDVVDALVAYAVGFFASALVLGLLGELQSGMSMREMVGKVSLQAVPASIGALLSQSQLGERDDAQATRGGVATYWSELFIMLVGALFLAFNLAPTEEMVQIAVKLSDLATCGLILASLILMHVFVYGAAFRGRPDDHRNASRLSVLLRFGVVGYSLAFLVSAYMLWTFGRLDGLALAPALQVIAVLAFPAAIGAAAARLIL